MSRAPVGKAFAVYTAWRLALFAGGCGLLLLARVPGPLAVVGGALLSGVASLFVLRRRREALAQALTERRSDKKQERTRLRGLLEDEP